jgi:hypothetical protein
MAHHLARREPMARQRAGSQHREEIRTKDAENVTFSGHLTVQHINLSTDHI